MAVLGDGVSTWQHEKYQEPVIRIAKRNAAIINVISFTWFNCYDVKKGFTEKGIEGKAVVVQS